MKTAVVYFAMLNKAGIRVGCIIAFAAILLLQACDKSDPKPVNEEEVITTLTVTLTPGDGGMPVTLKFFDADGEHGSTAPVYTVSGPLKASTTYSGNIELLNETENPAEDITAEVRAEAGDHLFCFATTGSLTIGYADADNNGLPVGIATSWVTGAAGEAEITVTLRHQSGTKTGHCPGSGETDLEVVFAVSIVQG